MHTTGNKRVLKKGEISQKNLELKSSFFLGCSKRPRHCECVLIRVHYSPAERSTVCSSDKPPGDPDKEAKTNVTQPEQSLSCTLDNRHDWWDWLQGAWEIAFWGKSFIFKMSGAICPPNVWSKRICKGEGEVIISLSCWICHSLRVLSTEDPELIGPLTNVCGWVGTTWRLDHNDSRDQVKWSRGLLVRRSAS